MTATTEAISLTSTKQLAWICAEARKAADIVLLKVAEVCYLTDYFVLATGFSRTQVRAIADFIDDRVEKELGKRPIRVEGKTDASWIVLDYGDAIVHIFMPEEREFYDLEAFWGHAERIEFSTIKPI
jgi:ribosome-associated protein